jgi:hypothetical protein
LIALVTIGTVMLLVLVMCSVLTCLKKKQPPAAAAHGAGTENIPNILIILSALNENFN